MKWTIHNTLVCPHSGVAFSSISSLRFLKFILWYEADILLLPGESIKLYSSSVLINEQYHAVKVYNITRYDEAQWEKLRERPSCPYHSTATTAESCRYQALCAIKRCPNDFPRAVPGLPSGQHDLGQQIR
ncbi:TPA: anti-adapter protein IraM [Klebsiella oxytoca]|nr:anti-adapter protein IraM [Klebsiella oxytoca]